MLIHRAQAKAARDWNNVSRSLRIGYHRLFGKQLPYELWDFWLTNAFLRKAAQYRIESYPGKLIVFRAHDDRNSPAPDLGWSRYAEGGVSAYEVPGDHHTLTHDPNVQVLAAQLAACLRAADESAG